MADGWEALASFDRLSVKIARVYNPTDGVW